MTRRDSVAAFLRLEDALAGAPAMRNAWRMPSSDRKGGPWFSWQRRNARSSGVPAYKLYVSPSPGSLRDALAVVVATLAGSEALSFKVGAEVHGVLRPDRLVAYFGTFAALERSARALERALHGIEADGVPFTGALTADGLLSWGSDPPGSAEPSWRWWVANRLAEALAEAKTARPDMTPERFALERVAFHGVDPERWTPAAVAWLRSRAR
jgi:hypothetical protein